MCKYCDLREDIHPYGEHTDMKGEVICDGKYEVCRIIQIGISYHIQLLGSYETLSDPIGYCPFCGRKLE